MITKKRFLNILLTLALALGLMLAMTLTAYADVPQSGSNAYVGYTKGYRGFDVYGRNGDSTIQTTYGNGGYASVMQVGDNASISFSDFEYGFEYGKEYASDDVKASITARVRGKAVLVTYTLVNTSDEAKTVKIGSYADTQIGRDDWAPCSFTDSGIKMTSIDGTLEFQLIPGGGNFTTRWYGAYYEADDNVFVNRDDTSTYTYDSGMAWSWTIEIPAGATVTKTAELSAGQVGTVQIIYDANGGTGEMDPTVDIPGKSVKLDKNVYTKDNCTFEGWDTNSEGKTVVYADEASLTMPDADMTLYAVWQENPEITATSKGYEGVYDGQPHGITVTVTDPTSGVEIKYGTAEGTYDLDDSPTITDVKNSSLTVYFKVTAEGYKDYTGSAIVTISKKAASVKAKDQNIKIGDTVPDLSSPVLDTHYTVTGLVGEDKLTTDPTLAYSAAPDNTKAGTYTITPSGASAGDNYTISYETGTLTISNKQIQTITAEDVTVIYGDKDKKITATTTGDGKLSYAVKSGDAVTVDKDTGALTIVEAGNAVITVTASETDTYAQATKDVTVTVAEEEKKPQQLAVKLTHYKDDGSYGVPSDIGETVWKLHFTLSLNDEEYSSAETAELAVKPGEKEQTITVLFPAELDMAKLSNDYKVTVSGYETTVKANIYVSGAAGAQDVPRYAVSIGDPSFINDEDGNVVLTLKVKWSGGKPQPKPEVIKVYALPEDEVGAYRLNDDGTKDYLLFHTYDICMSWLGSDELCRGYERCFHKESPYVNPFVKP